MELINNELKDKKILILGFGREGKSTYKYIRRYFCDKQIGIADINESIINEDLIKNDNNLNFHLGKDYMLSMNEYDIVIKAPGISLKNQITNNFSEKITSQTDLMLKYYCDNIIGVTGTKGKTTTVTLLAHTLKNAGKKVVLVGNVGLPVFDEIENIEKDTIIAYEVSSHQLEYVHNSPHIALITNIHQEHLDHYKDYDAYQRAKFNIIKYQKYKDIVVYNSDNGTLYKLVNNNAVLSEKLSVAQENIKDAYTYVKDEYIYYENEKVYDINQKRNLIGKYNLYNIMLVITVCKRLGIANEVIAKSIETYIPEPHRLEYVGCYEGINFYDNSIATVPIATTGAIEGLRNVDTLIIGGYDRNIDYTEFAEYLINSDINNILCIYETGNRIYNMIKSRDDNKNILLLDNLEEAVKNAKRLTKKGKNCLLSPTAASYGHFKNFEERGATFAKLVKEE